MHLVKSVLFAMSAFSISAAAEIITVPSVDLTQYVGRWYQISANPMPFDKGCHCSQQTLTLLATSHIGVHNSCNRGSVTGEFTEIRGEATVADKKTNAKFVVDFNLPVKGDYWIIGLAPDYSWAVVTEPNGLALFILSRTPVMTPQAYDAALLTAATQVNTSNLQNTVQEGCTYP